MKQKVCCIFGAGEYFGDEAVPQGALVIAADAGIKQCQKLQINPDVIIGDFDSLGHTLQGDNVIQLPVIKDDTDTLAAVRYALEKGCGKIIIFGGTGGRISHTLANIQTLAFIAAHGAVGILNDEEEYLIVTDKSVSFDADHSGFVSVFSVGDTLTLSETGLKYTLERGTLCCDFPLGTSNEFIGEPSHITVHGGTALIAVQKQGKEEFLN